MKQVIAQRYGDIWVQVSNLDYEEAEKEAVADKGHREVCYIEDGVLSTFISEELPEPPPHSDHTQP